MLTLKNRLLWLSFEDERTNEVDLKAVVSCLEGATFEVMKTRKREERRRVKEVPFGALIEARQNQDREATITSNTLIWYH